MLEQSLLVRKKPLHFKNNKGKVRYSYVWFVAVAEQYLLWFYKCIFLILKKRGEGRLNLEMFLFVSYLTLETLPKHISDNEPLPFIIASLAVSINSCKYLAFS